MKFLNYTRIGVLAITLLFVVSSSAWSQSTFKAGIAQVDITPEEPVPMSGYADREQPSKGVHDKIFAHAVVFDDGTQKACIVRADVIGFSHEMVDALRERIRVKTGIPAANTMIIAVHNHSAPSTRVYGEGSTPSLDKYIVSLQDKMVAAVVEADKSRTVASIGLATGSCTMNINRRAPLADGSIWLGRNPDGPCDHQVDVIRLENSAKKTLGLMVNWPCHATVGGQENSLISGDWPGATARFVQSKMGSEFPVAVTAGASGDINPIYGPNDNFRDMDAIGSILANEIIKVNEGIQPWPGGKITALTKDVQVPGKKRFDTRNPNQPVIAGDPVLLRLSILKVGEIVFAGISGELMNEIGIDVKEQSPFTKTVFVTHCNGSSGYLCTDAAYQLGGYEPMVSRTQPGVARIIVDTFNEMLRKL